MNIWQAEITKIVYFVMGSPKTTMELIILIVLALATSLIVLQKMSNALHFPVNDDKRSSAVIAVAVLFIIVAVTSANIYILPHLSNHLMRLLLPFLAGLIITLAIVVPLACFLYKANYLQVALSLFLTIISACIIVLLARAGLNAFKTGNAGFSITRHRTEDINDFLGK